VTPTAQPVATFPPDPMATEVSAEQATESSEVVEPEPVATEPNEQIDATTTEVTTEPTSTTRATNEQMIITEQGVISYSLPDGTTADPHPMPNLPDFVVGYAKWFVDCCYMKIAIEHIYPPFPDAERISTPTFESGGLQWSLDDTGPRNGSIIEATATAGELTIILGAQDRFPGIGSELAPKQLTEELARTVHVTVVS
jgi:hypothetical protein